MSISHRSERDSATPEPSPAASGDAISRKQSVQDSVRHPSLGHGIPSGGSTRCSEVLYNWALPCQPQ